VQDFVPHHGNFAPQGRALERQAGLLDAELACGALAARLALVAVDDVLHHADSLHP
jgi:hypothetical protein